MKPYKKPIVELLQIEMVGIIATSLPVSNNSTSSQLKDEVRRRSAWDEYENNWMKEWWNTCSCCKEEAQRVRLPPFFVVWKRYSLMSHLMEWTTWEEEEKLIEIDGLPLFEHIAADINEEKMFASTREGSVEPSIELDAGMLGIDVA